MFSSIIVLIAILAVISAQTYPNVKVELYYEALCPGCISFISGPLTSVLGKQDLYDIIDLVLVPYGNTKANNDGSYTCQHGADECASDVIELCALYKFANNITAISTGATSKLAWPFIQCVEANYGGASSSAPGCYASTGAEAASGIPYSVITTCAANEGAAVQAQGNKATPADHTYTPWPLVDGVLLEHPDLLQQAVCNAYTGPKPISCRQAADRESVCLNH